MRDHASKLATLPALKGQRGITGIETAIVLIAFVVVASVFAFANLSTGLYASDKTKETIAAGLAQARGALELRGSIIAKVGTTGDEIGEIYFQVANAAGGDAVGLTPGETLITYADADQLVTLVSGDFTATGLGGADSDNLVEPAEMYELKITGLAAKLDPDLPRNKTFVLQVKPSRGITLRIERTTPVALDTYNDLG